jgi:hypothetical protein
MKEICLKANKKIQQLKFYNGKRKAQLFYGGNNGFSIKICRYTMHQRLLFK